MFRITSVYSDVYLELIARQDDGFTALLGASDHTAMRRVWAYTDSSGVASLFRDAASNWRGWCGPKNWASIEGELQLTLTADVRGHITLEVVLSHDIGNVDPWMLRANIGLEAGQLESVARQAEAFFG